VKHDHGGYQPQGFQVCARLVHISEPFDAGTKVELKYELAGCHGLLPGGVLVLPVDPAQVGHYLLGDEISIRVRPL
jgi:hypothetical protein